MTRLNITLPDDIAKKLAAKSNRSRFIALVLKEEFDREKRKEAERLMAEGYKAVSKEDKKINDDWDKLSLEKWD